MSRPPRIAVSACLLGYEVRYDATHKAVALPLPEDFELIPVCPEVEAGLGVPRPPVRLVATGSGIRALGADDPELDVTERILALSNARLKTLAQADGCILKRNSPSCGIRGVPIYPEGDAVPQGRGHGLFAALLHEALPDLPLVDETELARPAPLQRFLEQVETRWQSHLADEKKGP